MSPSTSSNSSGNDSDEGSLVSSSSELSLTDLKIGVDKEYKYELPPTLLPKKQTSQSDTEGSSSEASSSSYSGSSLDLPESYPPLPTSAVPQEVLDIDAATPDSWVKRDERLVRLTGKHPFNVEAPLTPLYDAGFLTPTELFYVRNHGAVPKVDGELLDSWRIDLSGLVQNPMSLSLHDLKTKFEVVTLPVTLVCAGNRRKEQNVVKKGLGFNWGAAGLSTALFTGVYLCDVLEAAKVLPGAKHVIFEGADPLPQGKYGTSQLLSYARQKEKGILISWLMNGLPLEPDHGFPIRVVVPGQIGGRSVKWLNKIEVSKEESQHWLHFWDNKLLPTEVTPEAARAEKHWWYNRKYLINDLNVNSAIVRPAHNELLPPAPAEDQVDAQEIYEMKGYAYAGGGRRITRIEASLDEGDTWTLGTITYPEDLYRSLAYASPVFGNIDLTDREENFCWCFWSFPIKKDTLRKYVAANGGGGSLQVRAMDEALSVQQRDMYWNAMSMMNNWWFRVAIHQEADGSLRFEHPTMPGTESGGWMQRLKDEGQDILKPIFTKAAVSASAVPVPKKKKETFKMTDDEIQGKKMITMAEVQAHNTEGEPWFVVQGEVYDGTGFLKDHPGGAESITLVAGEDATEDFMAIHSPQGKNMLASYHIGTLIPATASSDEVVPVADIDKPKTIDPIFLSKTKWKSVELASIEKVSHDSALYRFKLEAENQPLGLPIGQHVYVRLRRKGSGPDDEMKGEMVQRAYTPVSMPGAIGYIDLLIKIYHRTDAYPEGGKMTIGFHELVVGDSIEMKGPIGHFVWLGGGVAEIKHEKRKFKNIGMICGGSGVTPILQVLRGIFMDTTDTETNVWLLNSNKTEADILCREELDALLEASHANGRYRLHHTLSSTPDGWTQSKGRITLDMMRDHLPPPAEDSMILICGPDAMIEATVKPNMVKLGWNTDTQLTIF